jgi:integrase
VGPFFRIAILTLQRREEVAAMRWSEMAPNLSVWNMPRARMKNGKRHDVHLSRPAQAVLRALSEALSKDRGGAKGPDLRLRLQHNRRDFDFRFLKGEGPSRCRGR